MTFDPMRPWHYKLDENGEPVASRDLLDWALWYQRSCEDGSRRVALEDFGEGLVVSTVFLGLDHGYTGGPPVLWETLVFYHWEGDWKEQETGTMQRYTSRADAIAGHAQVVREVRVEVETTHVLASDVVAEIIVKVRNRL